jgi:hypothetical protein
MTEEQGLHGNNDEQLLLDAPTKDERGLASQPAAGTSPV